jgi:hypothetical protein
MIGLIVFGVLVVMIAAAAVTCYVKRDALLKFGITAAIDGVSAKLAEEPIEGVDTEKFQGLATAFLEKFKTDTVTIEDLSGLAAAIQTVAGNDFGAKEVDNLTEAMLDFYPDLAELTLPVEAEVDDITDTDSEPVSTE